MKVMSDAAFGEVANYFRVLAEPLRLKILNALRSGDLNVGQVCAAVNSSQANVSKHLQILLEAGLVARRPQGTSAIYSIADPFIFTLCEQVCDRLAERLQAEATLRASLFRP